MFSALAKTSLDDLNTPSAPGENLPSQPTHYSMHLQGSAMMNGLRVRLVLRLMLLALLPRTVQAMDSSVVETHPRDGYRGIWYWNQKSEDEYAFKYSGGLATYCAKHNPFAVYCPQVGKTFFCYGGTTVESHDELVHMVSYYDHKTGEVPRPRFLLNKNTDDAHDNPVISVDEAGHVWIFSTSHGRGRPSLIHRSLQPYSIDRFVRVDATYQVEGKQRPLDNFSYLQVWQTPAYGFAAFFTHYGSPAARTSFFMTSRDGRRWSSWHRLAAIEEGHYQISAIEDDLAATAFNYHPQGKGLNWRTNLYYMQTPDGGASWSNVAGEPIEIPLTESDNACLVHDYTSAGRNVYLKDIRFDAARRPVILVITSNGPWSGPQHDPRRWEFLRWDGRQWNRSSIAPADSNYDMGSLYYYAKTEFWRLIAPRVGGPQEYNPGGEISAWTSADQGATWQVEQQLTSDSPLNHTYVRRPVNHHDDFVALWADGDARQPSKSRLYFCNRAGDVFQLPEKMTGATAQPRQVKRNPN